MLYYLKYEIWTEIRCTVIQMLVGLIELGLREIFLLLLNEHCHSLVTFHV